MNWGNSLILVFVVFALFIGTMVYKATTIHNELVSKDYYKDEIAYQQVIDGRKNAGALSRKVELSATPTEVVVQLPEEMKGKKTEGEIYFYCPADASRDIKAVMKMNENAQQVLDRNRIKPADYMVKVSWRVDSTRYYFEDSLLLK